MAFIKLAPNQFANTDAIEYIGFTSTVYSKKQFVSVSLSDKTIEINKLESTSLVNNWYTVIPLATID